MKLEIVAHEFTDGNLNIRVRKSLDSSCPLIKSSDKLRGTLLTDPIPYEYETSDAGPNTTLLLQQSHCSDHC